MNKAESEMVFSRPQYFSAEIKQAELRRVANSLSMPAHEIIGNPLELVTEHQPHGSNRFIQEERGKIFEMWEKLQTECFTDKGRFVNLLRLFHKDYRINQTVFKADDKEGLKKQILSCIDNDNIAGLRTCYSAEHRLGRAPWVMGLKTPRQVAAFFGDIPIQGTPLWTEPSVKGHQTYQRWLNEELCRGLKEIIVMENPPEFTQEESSHFFAFRAFIYGGNKFEIELRDKTPQLRSLDGSAPRSKFIEITASIKDHIWKTYELEEILVKPGDDYFKGKTSKKIREKIQQDGIIWQDEKDEVLKKHLNFQALKTIEQVINFVYFDSCKSPYNHLYYRLHALSEFGLQAVEFQGRHAKNGDKGWIKAYGFRGTKEGR